ncbi:MAG TPA: helix-turn-helix domain-containing protein, partial [Trebonia sp.]
MCRYRLEPTAAQGDALLRHCADARYVWNLCVEQEACWRAGRGRMPGFAGRCRQLTDARADVNAARNIAAGHAVKARGGDRTTGPMNREPQPALL